MPTTAHVHWVLLVGLTPVPCSPHLYLAHGDPSTACLICKHALSTAAHPPPPVGSRTCAPASVGLARSQWPLWRSRWCGWWCSRPAWMMLPCRFSREIVTTIAAQGATARRKLPCQTMAKGRRTDATHINQTRPPPLTVPWPASCCSRTLRPENERKR